MNWNDWKSCINMRIKQIKKEIKGKEDEIEVLSKSKSGKHTIPEEFEDFDFSNLSLPLRLKDYSKGYVSILDGDGGTIAVGVSSETAVIVISIINSHDR